MAIEAGCKDAITDEIVDKAILKSKKICQEQIDTCPVNRPDLLEAYTICMGYIDELAPKMMSEDEVRIIVEKLFSPATSLSKGLFMKEVMAQLKGKADGKLINRIVSEYF